MTIGTTVVPYDTKASPMASRRDGGTPIESTGTIGMLTVFKDTVINDNYRLQMDLIAVVKVEDDKYVVVDYQIDEYGIGDSQEEAQQDLFDSLVDYLESLERRENRIADRELRNLQLLRSMLSRR